MHVDADSAIALVEEKAAEFVDRADECRARALCDEKDAAESIWRRRAANYYGIGRY